MANSPNIIFCGDVHGNFGHLVDIVKSHRPDGLILLGDIEAQRPLEEELRDVLDSTTIRFIPGNHDTDSLENYENLFASKIAAFNLHGRVEDIAGVRIAGLGGIFRQKVWYPPADPTHNNHQSFVKALNTARPFRERSFPKTHVMSDQERRQKSSIYYDDYLALSKLKADVLVLHEAPDCHPHGFTALSELARVLGVKTVFHGHHHDCLDYREHWASLGFQVFGVGFCGLSGLDGRVIKKGDFDG